MNGNFFMNNLKKYYLVKDNSIIKTGYFPTFFLIGGWYSLIEFESKADWMEVEFEDRIIKLYAPRLLYKNKPESVSLENHKKWFSGCIDKLE